MAADGTILLKTDIDQAGINRGISTMKRGISSLTSQVAKLGAAIGIAFGISALVAFGKAAVDIASDLQEVQNVVDTAFRSMSYKIEEFSKTAIESFGISELTAKRTASTYMAMAQGMQIAAGAGSDMAINLTALSADMASFYNVSQEIADTALKSVFTGETETLKQFGIVMTDINLQEYARQRGIEKSISAMTQQEKTMLRYNYVMEQTKLAQGDFAKTSDGWANSVRVLQERWKQMQGQFGQAFMAIGSLFIPVVNDMITGLTKVALAAQQAAKWVYKAFTGKELQLTNEQTQIQADNIAGSVENQEDLTQAIKDTEKANKRALAGFDEIQKLTGQTSDNLEDTGSINMDLITPYSSEGGYGDTTTPDLDTEGISKYVDFFKNAFSTLGSWFKTNFGPIFTDFWASFTSNALVFRDTLGRMWDIFMAQSGNMKAWFTNDFTPFLQAIASFCSTVINGVFDSFNLVFADFVDNLLPVLLDSFFLSILPFFTQLGTELVKTAETVFVVAKTIFDTVYAEGISPALDLILKVWSEMWDSIYQAWQNWGTPIFDGLRTAVETTGELFLSLWDNMLKPIWDSFMAVIDELWTNHLRPLLDNFLDFVGELITGALTIYNQVISPIIIWLVEMLGPVVSTVLSAIFNTVGGIIGNIIDIISGLITVLKGIIQFIVGVFTGDWDKAWTGIKNIFGGVWDSLVALFKIPLNLIISGINLLVVGVANLMSSLVNIVVGAINLLIKGVLLPLNLAIDGLNKIPGVDIKKVEFSIPTVPALGEKVYQIPHLAKGAVIPPNREFMAVLGDQKQGTNIETPEALLRQIMREELGDGGRVVKEEIYNLSETELMRIIYKLVKGGEKINGNGLVTI